MPLLDWLNKPESLKTAGQVPYRLLEGVPELSYGDVLNEKLLIQGDNLEALKALLPPYAGRVKCIYIDPPYNTRSAFEHYDDNLEHSQWLSMMYPRLELLRDLLAEDGSIWVSIDDHEGHYLKVMLDNIFGRKNFISNVVWQKVYSIKNSAKHLSEMHDHILVYAKHIDGLTLNQVPRNEKSLSNYKNPDNDLRGLWRAGPLAARNYYNLGTYSITCPSGRVIDGPPAGSYWRYSRENFDRLDQDGRIWWGKEGNNVPAPKLFLSEVGNTIVPATLWKHEEAGHNQDAKREIVALYGNDIFGTPKPERLIERILHIATNEGGLVLDSFLGSGTTAAVAHKMNRHYIGIEMGEHATTHCQPRLKKVIDGEQGGISEIHNWQGGGGFTFYKLGNTVFDEYGMIDPAIRFPTLAAYIWYLETRIPWQKPASLSPLMGVHNDTAYYLLYNGILGDRRPQGGNVLTQKVLDSLPEFAGKKVIYGETTRFGNSRLTLENITFKQIPYDVKVG